MSNDLPSYWSCCGADAVDWLLMVDAVDWRLMVDAVDWLLMVDAVDWWLMVAYLFSYSYRL
jgi:hypothetical protein